MPALIMWVHAAFPMTRYSELLDLGSPRDDRWCESKETTRALVTLAEPERLNPLSAGLVMQLQACLAELTQDPTLRSILLTGADPAFSAGGDLAMIESRLGHQAAMALYVSGRHLDAAEALRLGLAQEVHSHEELLPAAERWCKRID